jgi:hypothetical protein
MLNQGRLVKRQGNKCEKEKSRNIYKKMKMKMKGTPQHI